MKKIAAEGGTALPICDLPGASSATWNQDTIVAGNMRHDLPSNVISVRSGAVSPWKLLLWPKFLPDGKHLLYVRADPKIGAYRAHVAEMSTGRETALMLTDTQVIFVPDQVKGGSQGYLLFGRNSTLLALRFDADRLQMAGEPVPVAKEVPFFEASAWSEFEASADGVLIYSTGSQRAQLTWFDRSGRESGTVDDPRDFAADSRVSPDGKKLAATVLDFSTGGGDIWVYDLSQGTAERVTFGPPSGAPISGAAVWSPDGTRIAFFIAKAGVAPQLRMKGVSERGGGEQFPPGPFQMPSDWSSDDRWIFFTTSAGVGNGEIWLASVKDRKIMPLLQTPFDSASPILSWDREYLAFSANDTGRYEIYVQHFQGGGSPKLVGERRRVSHNGGNLPRWRRDGKELFFISPDRQIMAVAVKPGIETDFGPPTALFRLPTYLSAAGIGGYEVSHDGQKFLAPIPKGASPSLQVVINWQAGLKE
ncbi:MAG: hypothetical protein ACR2IV_17440 [Bryobacteraceae bacterium]